MDISGAGILLSVGSPVSVEGPLKDRRTHADRY